MGRTTCRAQSAALRRSSSCRVWPPCPSLASSTRPPSTTISSASPANTLECVCVLRATYHRTTLDSNPSYNTTTGQQQQTTTNNNKQQTTTNTTTNNNNKQQQTNK